LAGPSGSALAYFADYGGVEGGAESIDLDQQNP